MCEVYAIIYPQAGSLRYFNRKLEAYVTLSASWKLTLLYPQAGSLRYIAYLYNLSLSWISIHIANRKDWKPLMKRKRKVRKTLTLISQPEIKQYEILYTNGIHSIPNTIAKLYNMNNGWKSLKKYLIHNRLKNDLNNNQDILGITDKTFILDSSPILYTGLMATSDTVQKAIFNLTNMSFGIPYRL